MQKLARVALLVRDYDEAIAYYMQVLGFRLLEDTPLPEQGKRWVVVAPSGEGGAALVLARASTAQQQAHVGAQSGGRVFLFLHTDDLERDYQLYRSRGVPFVRAPARQAHGSAAVFSDLYGNLWDLVQPHG